MAGNKTTLEKGRRVPASQIREPFQWAVLALGNPGARIFSLSDPYLFLGINTN